MERVVLGLHANSNLPILTPSGARNRSDSDPSQRGKGKSKSKGDSAPSGKITVSLHNGECVTLSKCKNILQGGRCHKGDRCMFFHTDTPNDADEAVRSQNFRQQHEARKRESGYT